MGIKYYTTRYDSSNCFITEFTPGDEFRADATIGRRGKLERLSTINGEPAADEKVVAKINGGFFAMNGSKEYIGTFVDDGLYYNGSTEFYPTFIYWKDHHCSIELNPTQQRHAEYQQQACWAIGSPWSLVIDGKINHLYPNATIQKVYGHFTSRAPRTLIGQKADKTMVLVVVDGRKVSSRGITGPSSAKLMLQLGCTQAVNLDGGGSSEMIYNGKIVNKPSDGSERYIGTAIMVYQKTAKPSTPTNTTITAMKATGKITATSLNVRSGPSANGKKIGNLSKDTDVSITGVAPNGWYQIAYGSAIGYISNQYVKLNPTDTSTGTTTTGVWLRSGPGTTYKKIICMPKGANVTIQSTVNGWYAVKYQSYSGYVCAKYVK